MNTSSVLLPSGQDVQSFANKYVCGRLVTSLSFTCTLCSAWVQPYKLRLCHVSHITAPLSSHYAIQSFVSYSSVSVLVPVLLLLFAHSFVLFSLSYSETHSAFSCLLMLDQAPDALSGKPGKIDKKIGFQQVLGFCFSECRDTRIKQHIVK